ncbi:MAG TPA: DciA family protein [Patescibacteria group bacterium]|nr:DciA family protein [Patescibacteria group bacterium]
MDGKPEARKSAEPQKPAEDRRGSAGPRSIAETTARLTRKPMGKRGFAEAALVADWVAIVGSMIGLSTLPLRVSFPPGERIGGTLHIRVSSGAIATQLQHQEPLIVQRINGHFGYGAVARLAMTQGPLPKRKVRRPPKPPELTPAAEHDLQDRLAVVEDPELREVLARLGRHLAARR